MESDSPLSMPFLKAMISITYRIDISDALQKNKLNIDTAR
jgi:hypothetical protein